MIRTAIATLILLLPAVAQARPVVVELFTSEACSSCPPADALLRQLKGTEADLLPLDLHVTYWNGTGWIDPFSLSAATERQQWYASLADSSEVYTPEAVVDGRDQVIGSDRRALLSAIASLRSEAASAVPVTIAATGDEVQITVGSGSGSARLWLFGFDDSHTTYVGGGENRGATLREINVVRSMNSPGIWNGSPATFRLSRPRGTHLAVLLQQENGRILGATAD
ncbi:MAG TPA: DUF1223 domain-containing protein [Acetobacteraceae bacterium]|nr:DUF1223 domain-containing protein [Acetobacteraceae bacterium]